MDMGETHRTPHEVNVDASHGYETSDVRLRPILMLGAVLVVGAVIGHLVLWGLFSFVTGRLAQVDPPPPPLARTDQPPPAPRLQVSPRADWREMVAAHNQMLNSYGWVDQERGIARIPIERAMDLVLERGLLKARSGGAELQESPDLQEADDLDSEGGQPPGNED